MEKAVRALTRPPWNIEAIYAPWTEYAWNFSDFPEILRYFQKNNYIVLGGDILTTELEYTYDNWYYNPDRARSIEENVKQSTAVTADYLTHFRDRKGADYLIVFVVTRRFP